MKQRRKGFLLLVMCLLFAMIPGNLVFAAAESGLSDEEAAQYEMSATQTIQAVTAFTDDEIEQYLTQSTEAFVTSTVESWKSAKAELGAFVEITEQQSELKDNEITVTSQVTFENGTATVPLIIDRRQGQAISLSFDINYTMAEQMSTAGLNTLMGVGVVFLMLIFLSFCISLFRYIPKLEAALKGKQAAPAENRPAPVETLAVVETVEEELVDDGELAAVIAAAIAASEDVPVDGFRVRSIKKANVRRWRNA